MSRKRKAEAEATPAVESEEVVTESSSPKKKSKSEIVSKATKSAVKTVTSAGLTATGNAFPPKYFYHLAHTSNLPNIRKHGLLSTSKLVETLGIPVAEQRKIVNEHRPKCITLCDSVVIRDQSPMPPSALAKTLPPNMKPTDWYKLMNSFIFFWPSLERVERHRAAHQKLNADLSLMVFDAAKMIQDHGDKLFVSPINTGFALRKAANRSEKTSFVPYHEYMTSGWPVEANGTKRASSSLPVEVAIKDSFPLESYLIRVE